MRRGEVDPDLLASLDVPDAGRRGGEAFDKSQTENKRIGARAGDKGAAAEEDKGDGGKRSEQIHKDDGKPEIVNSTKIRSADMSPDKIQKLVESGQVDVSPEYRRIVERYFGELSEK